MNREKSKFRKFLLGVLYVISSICLVFAIINALPPKKAVENNPFISPDRTMAAAHRGGGDLNPENTLKAHFLYIESHT